jgi:uncharacterized protein YdbL (DUF1318 family)
MSISKSLKMALPLALSLAAAGCIETRSEVEIKPIEIKPMTIDINLNVKVDKALDEAMNPAAAPVAPVGEKEKLYAALRGSRPRLEELRNAGTIGENNKGMTEFRVPLAEVSAEDQLLVAQTNYDRGKLYKMIAAEEKTTVEFVANRRTARIMEKAAAGVWVQNADGVWEQKK